MRAVRLADGVGVGAETLPTISCRVALLGATDWQQHSARGFLAGTVKRKLGFPLTSSKPNDGVRRYRIETRRAR
jgi:hypothetical protein